MTIKILASDLLNFNAPTAEVVALFGQTSSHAIGLRNTQSVLNGSRLDFSEQLSLNQSAESADPTSNGADLPVLAVGSIGLGNGWLSEVYADQIEDFVKDIFSDPGAFEEIVENVGGTVLQSFLDSGSASEDQGAAVGFGASDIVDILTFLEGFVTFHDSEDALSIVINTGDTFNFNVGDIDIVKMFGQTVSYVAGVDNQQTVINGGNLVDRTVDSGLSAAAARPAASEARQPLLPDEESAQVPDRVPAQALNTPKDLPTAAAGVSVVPASASSPSIIINSGDSFDFDVGDVSIVKMFGQTVSYLDGFNNTQTVVDGASISAAGQGSLEATGKREPGRAEAASSGKTDGSDDLDSGSTAPKQAGQSGKASKEADDRNGGQDPSQPSGRPAVSEKSEAETTSDQGISIAIDTGDSFDFDVGDVNVVKMAGQTVSYASGIENQQSVVNGPVVLSETDSSTAAEKVSGSDGKAREETASSTSQAPSGHRETQSASASDIKAQAASGGVSIKIDTADSFDFEVGGDTDIVKLFGQTVSHVKGAENTQSVTNGSVAEVEPSTQADLEAASSKGQTTSESASTAPLDVIEDVLEDIGIDDDAFIEETVAGFTDEVQSLIEEIFAEESVVSEVTGVFDELIGDLGSGASVSELLDQRLEDDDYAELEAVVAEVNQYRDRLDDGDDLTVDIRTGDDFSFTVDDSVEVTKMFGQTVSLLEGEGSEQTIVNGSVVETSSAAKTLTASESDPSLGEARQAPGARDLGLAAPKTLTVRGDDVETGDRLEAADGALTAPSIVINSGASFDVEVESANIVKLFGQTVSYLDGANLDQTVINGNVVDGESEENSLADSAQEDWRLDPGLAEIARGLEAYRPEAGQDEASLALLQSESDDSEIDEIGGILEAAFDFLDSTGDDRSISIVIDSRDTFNFNVGEVTVAKMFGQTVSYAIGANNVQSVVNGTVLDVDSAQATQDFAAVYDLF
ncbi:MAG: hypothetical protein Kilf2KO_04740 [Rhodospirillales bacterium]